MTYLISQQLDHKLAIVDLHCLDHLQGTLPVEQSGHTLGGEEAHLAQALALPPFGIGGIDDGHYVARSAQDTSKGNQVGSDRFATWPGNLPQVELIDLSAAKVVEHHEYVGR